MSRLTKTEPHKKRVLKSKADRRREIIDATIEVIGEHGLRGTTISRIAATVGLTKGALYYYFPNREALLLAAFDQLDANAAGWITGLTGRGVPADLLAMAETHAGWTLSVYRTFLRPFYQLLSSKMRPELASVITEKSRRYHDEFAAWVEQGKREGSIRKDVDSREVGLAFVAHAWAEDTARLIGIDEFIDDGMSLRIFKRLMEAYMTPDSDDIARETLVKPSQDGGL